MHFISWDGWLYIGPGRIRFQREVKVFRTYASCRIFVYTLVALVEIKTALCRTSILSMNWLSLSVDVSLTYNFCVLASCWRMQCAKGDTHCAGLMLHLAISLLAWLPQKLELAFDIYLKSPSCWHFKCLCKTIILN